MPGAFWLAILNTLVLKSRASSWKLGLSHRSNTGTLSFGGSIDPASRARDKGYLELHGTRHLSDDELRLVGTEVRGEGADPRTLEEGVVHRTIAVHQSMRQDPPAAPGWENSTFMMSCPMFIRRSRGAIVFWLSRNAQVVVWSIIHYDQSCRSARPAALQITPQTLHRARPWVTTCRSYHLSSAILQCGLSANHFPSSCAFESFRNADATL